MSVKQRMKMTGAVVVAVCVVGGMLTGFASTDADGTNAADAVDAVQSVAPAAVSDIAETTSTMSEAASTEVGDSAVAVPRDPSAGVKLDAPGTSSDATIGLPFARLADDAAASQKPGIVVYDNNNGSSTVPVTHTDGSVQISTVIENANAPTRYDYPLTLPVGHTLRLADTGAAYVGDDNGDVLLVIAAPWAKDAGGNDVPTHYEVNGNTLTQVVDFSANSAFPVVADPTVSWLWWGRTIKYSKNETRQVAALISDYSAVSFACSIGGAAAVLACGAVIGLGVHVVANAFRNAAARGRCMQLNIPYVGPGWLYEVSC